MRGDSRACEELEHAELVQRVAQALRDRTLGSTSLPPGRCALCFSQLPHSYSVTESIGDRVRSYDVAPGSPEEAAAAELKLKHPREVMMTPVRCCRRARAVVDEAEHYNRERRAAMTRPETPRAASPLPGIPRY